MHISTSVFGVSVWTLRLPTFIAGLLLVPATYAATRLYHGKNAALLAAALVSASSPLIEYSFNARGYSLGALFFMMMIVVLGLATEGFSGAWVFLPVMAALALYSVPTMVYGVGGVFLYFLLRRSELRKISFAALCTALLTLVFDAPVLGTVGLSAITNNKWVIPIPRNMWLSQCGRELRSLWVYWNFDLPRLVAILLVFGIVAGVFSRKSFRSPPMAIFLCVVVVASVLLPLQRVVPFRRTWLFLLPLYFASAALGMDLLIRKVRYPDLIAATLSLVFAGWMGATVLTVKSLRHSGIESVGGRSSESIVLGMKDRLLHGDQFVCTDSFDSPLDFEMYVHKIPYRPSPGGRLLIVTPAGKPPQRTLALTGIPSGDVRSIQMIAHYEDEDVYQGVRGAALPFQPAGSSEMGAFKTSRR